MRTDKTGSNHIGTVMGALLELAEGISTTEIRARMMNGDDKWDAQRREVDAEMLRAAKGLGGGSGGGGGEGKKRKLQ
jgi:hypothetical protein